MQPRASTPLLEVKVVFLENLAVVYQAWYRRFQYCWLPSAREPGGGGVIPVPSPLNSC